LRILSPVASDIPRERSASALAPIATNITEAIRTCCRAATRASLSSDPLDVDQVYEVEPRLNRLSRVSTPSSIPRPFGGRHQGPFGRAT
jgi:hypothetical protein